jgi:uncharacterized membrane-anchored protein
LLAVTPAVSFMITAKTYNMLINVKIYRSLSIITFPSKKKLAGWTQNAVDIVSFLWGRKDAGAHTKIDLF